ncbi:diacylglycerol/lipid kinase family protein [Trueperella sp. LYQ141]|uniref:diacylglycerol/lipid kinase family protein n=1 Tax=Trueperella sp. LYQ141 TaxID=3391058 RepID=UPI0039839723
MMWLYVAAVLGALSLVTVVILGLRQRAMRRELQDMHRRLAELKNDVASSQPECTPALARDNADIAHISSAEPELPAENNEDHAHVVRPPGPIVVVYNPTKNVDFDYIQRLLARVANDAGAADPIWIPTTQEDQGHGQTRQALAMGASVVITAGGDGTVRNCAEVLAKTGTPLGLLPVGTGNLLARNLDLPIHSLRRMAQIAITGKNGAIDVGWIEIPTHRPFVSGNMNSVEETKDVSHDYRWQHRAASGKYAFLVMAGMGFDADMMASADEYSELKSKIGWLAYVRAALPHLLAPKMRARIRTGPDTRGVTVDARTIMLMNCGELVGGMILDRHTTPDDGWLELAVLDTRHGLIGWADVARQVGFNGIGLQPVQLPGFENSGEIDVHRVARAQIEAMTAQRVQVDGDVLGYSRHIRAYIDPAALLVRMG